MLNLRGLTKSQIILQRVENKILDFLVFINIQKEDELIKILMNTLKDSTTFYHNYILFIRGNRFIGKKNKTRIEDLIFLGRRRMFLFKKYLRNWIHHKKYIYHNDCDLLLSKLDNNKKYPEIYENNFIYRFSKADIHNLIISNVIYGEYQIPRILPIKNPWTNSVLSKIQLYNLFISSNSTKRIPWIFKEYALCDFDPKIMIRKHRSYLSEEAIKIDINLFSEKEFRTECDKIFLYNIASLFLKNNLFRYNGLHSIDLMILKQIFKPIIRNAYINSTQHISSQEKIKLYNLLELYPSIIERRVHNNLNKKKSTNIMYIPFFRASLPSVQNFFTIEIDQDDNMGIDTDDFEAYEYLDQT